MRRTEWGPMSLEELRRLCRSRRAQGAIPRPEASEGIQEIRSGAIIPDPDRPGVYCIEANTATGLRKFPHAAEGGSIDSQSEAFHVPVGYTYFGPVHVTQWWPVLPHWPSIELEATGAPDKHKERGSRSDLTAEGLSPE